METVELVRGTFEDYWRRLDRTLRDLTPDELWWRPNPHSNSIGFIVWHVARVEDRWMTVFVRDTQDLWVSQQWFEKFGLANNDMGIEVPVEWLEEFPRISPDLLDGYRHAVADQTRAYLDQLDAPALDYVPGRTLAPERPRTLEVFGKWSVGRMFQQLIGEIGQHMGQVAYLRGMQRGLDG